MSATFTKDELNALHRALFRSLNGQVSKSDYEAVMDWAKDTRLNALLLDLVLQGYMDPFFNAGGELVFQLTAKGLESSRAGQLERISS